MYNHVYICIYILTKIPLSVFFPAQSALVTCVMPNQGGKLGRSAGDDLPTGDLTYDLMDPHGPFIDEKSWSIRNCDVPVRYIMRMVLFNGLSFGQSEAENIVFCFIKYVPWN